MTEEASRKDSGLAEHQAGYVDISCHDQSAFKAWSASDVQQVIALLQGASDRVRDGRMTRASFEDLGLSVGIRLNPRGLLASDALRSQFAPVETVTYDWVHTMLQDGVFCIEVALLVKSRGDAAGVD